MKVWMFFIGLLVVNISYADGPLTVIYDSGDTLPIEKYLPKGSEEKGGNSNKLALPFSLPITTPSMQPGRVSVTPTKFRYLQQPLFLVGADAMSKSWLIKKRDVLKKIGAVGLLIQAKSVDDIHAMQEIADGLRLVPASAEGLARELGLTHYPVLLSKEGIEQ